MFRTRPTLQALVVLAALAASHSPAQTTTCGIGSVQHVDTLSNGLRIHTTRGIEEITALKPDVLRIRISPTSALPEDASWAVVPEAHASTAPVTVDNSPSSITLHTAALTAELSRADLTLTVRDTTGRTILHDAQPVCFTGHAFRLSESMPLDEHYFALGDKTGPFDHRGQAFTLWNTDAYRFQESTDPVYKAILFFLTFRAGASGGVLLDNTWRSDFNFGRTTQGVYTFGAVDGPIDIY